MHIRTKSILFSQACMRADLLFGGICWRGRSWRWFFRVLTCTTWWSLCCGRQSEQIPPRSVHSRQKRLHSHLCEYMPWIWHEEKKLVASNGFSHRGSTVGLSPSPSRILIGPPCQCRKTRFNEALESTRMAPGAGDSEPQVIRTVYNYLLRTSIRIHLARSGSKSTLSKVLLDLDSTARDDPNAAIWVWCFTDRSRGNSYHRFDSSSLGRTRRSLQLHRLDRQLFFLRQNLWYDMICSNQQSARFQNESYTGLNKGTRFLFQLFASLHW
jgi:hypothetical protein